MTKNVRNNDSPSNTWFGGADVVPMAVRSKPRTMIMRVKPVIISSTAGRNAMALSSNRVCRLSDHC